MSNMNVKKVGYWYNEEDCDKDFPMPVPRDPTDDFKKTDYSAQHVERDSLEDHIRFTYLLQAVESLLMVEYFAANRNTPFVAEYRGRSTCRLCRESNGSLEFAMVDPNDGVEYHWPEGYLHYLKTHYVQPDPDFKNFIESLDGSLKGCCHRFVRLQIR